MEPTLSVVYALPALDVNLEFDCPPRLLVADLLCRPDSEANQKPTSSQGYRSSQAYHTVGSLSAIRAATKLAYLDKVGRIGCSST